MFGRSSAWIDTVATPDASGAVVNVRSAVAPGPGSVTVATAGRTLNRASLSVVTKNRTCSNDSSLAGPERTSVTQSSMVCGPASSATGTSAPARENDGASSTQNTYSEAAIGPTSVTPSLT